MCNFENIMKIEKYRVFISQEITRKVEFKNTRDSESKQQWDLTV